MATVIRVVAGLSGMVLLAVGTLWSTPWLFHTVAVRMGAAAAGASPRAVIVDGYSWPYLEAGARHDPAVLLLHGFGTSKDAMLLPTSWLRASHRVIVPDLPGFGDHPLPDGVLPSPDWYLNRIDDFANALGLERFSVVGTSMGGALAAAYAALHPERVDRLILLAPAGVEAPIKNRFMAEVEAGHNPLAIQSEADFEAVVELVFVRPPTVPVPFRRHVVSQMIERRAATARIVEGLRGFLLDGLSGRLPGVQAPTLVIYGQADEVTDPSMAERFRAELPGATIELIPDAGHVVFADAPRHVRELMLRFLSPQRPAGN